MDGVIAGAQGLDQFDESIAKGVVISTNPVAGAEVRRGTTVQVTVSKGPERYEVPESNGAPTMTAVASAKLAGSPRSQRGTPVKVTSGPYITP